MEKKKKWANALFIGLFIVGVFLSLPLAIYISDHPGSIAGKIVFAMAKFSGGFNGKDNFSAIAFGAFFLIFLANVLIWALFLKPIEIFGRNFWKAYLAMFRSLNPRYTTTRFGWNYGIAKILLEDLKSEDVQPEFKEEIARLVQARLDKMAELDPESPLLKEVAGEFYNVKTETTPDTEISFELKEWKELANKVDESEAEEESAGKRSYVYAGVVVLFVIGMTFIGLQAIFGKGATAEGLFDIIIGLVFGSCAIKRCVPRKNKG